MSTILKIIKQAKILDYNFMNKLFCGDIQDHFILFLPTIFFHSLLSSPTLFKQQMPLQILYIMFFISILLSVLMGHSLILIIQQFTIFISIQQDLLKLIKNLFKYSILISNIRVQVFKLAINPQIMPLNQELYLFIIFCFLERVFVIDYISKMDFFLQQRENRQLSKKQSSDCNQRYYEHYKKVYELSLTLTDQLQQTKIQFKDLSDKINYFNEKIEDLRDPIRPETTERKKKSRRSADEIDKQFCCSIENCLKEYATQASLKIHQNLKHPQIFQKDIEEKQEFLQ